MTNNQVRPPPAILQSFLSKMGRVKAVKKQASARSEQMPSDPLR